MNKFLNIAIVFLLGFCARGCVITKNDQVIYDLRGCNNGTTQGF